MDTSDHNPKLSSHYQLASTKVKRITTPRPNITCGFCGRNEVDEIRLGPLCQREGVTVHYFCMLFSSALCQNGSDADGILGFLSPDIQKEIKRASRLKCVYCDRTGASVGCCNKRCRELFHFPCGLDQGSSFQFHSKYESFCPVHSEHRKGTLAQALKSLHSATCSICTVRMSGSQVLVRGPCCRGSMFHKECIQKMALSAGYFFKCPLCNDKAQFVFEMKNSGVYVPEQDAAWERDNSYSELYMTYSRCDALKCHCQYGREYSKPNGAWLIARCRLCGAAGTHKQCGGLKNGTGNWACDPCYAVEKKANKTKNKIPNSKSSKSNETPASSLPSSTPIQSLNSSVSALNPLSSEPMEFRWREVMISKKCYAYFPYSRQILKKIQDPFLTLPDWRNLELQVNLVKWLPRIGIKYTVAPNKSKNKTTKAPTKRKNQTAPSRPKVQHNNNNNNNENLEPKIKYASGRARVRVSVSGNRLVTNNKKFKTKSKTKENRRKKKKLKYNMDKEHGLRLRETERETDAPELPETSQEEEEFSAETAFQAYQSQIIYQESNGLFQFAEEDICTFDGDEMLEPESLHSPRPLHPIEVITIPTDSSTEEEDVEEEEEEIMIIDEIPPTTHTSQPQPQPQPQPNLSLTPEQESQFQAQSHRIRNEMEKTSPSQLSVSPTTNPPLKILNSPSSPSSPSYQLSRRRKQLVYPLSGLKTK